jgi:integrase
MYDSKISILFYLQKSKLNKKNKCPLMCRITYSKKRKQFSTGIYISKTDWNSKKQISSNLQVNDQLQIITSELKSAYLKIKVSQKFFSVEEIYKEFKGETNKNEYGVLEYYNLMLAKKKKLIDIEMNQATWDKFLHISNLLKEFIKGKYKKKDVFLTNLSINFLEEFEFFLKTEKKHKQITANKAIQRFKGIIRVAVAEHLIDRNPFYAHKPKKVKKKVIFLNQQELKIIETKPISQDRLNKTRDCFVFCCYTGLAYKEMANLKKKHLIKGFDGVPWIQMTRDKTDKIISIPVLSKALEIIQKYSDLNGEYLLPILSNQRFNSYLKEIADIVGIEKNLTHHMARKTFASTVLLYNDVPMEIVSELLGHSNIKVTQAHYGKIVQKKVSEEMKNLSSKLKT